MKVCLQQKNNFRTFINENYLKNTHALAQIVPKLREKSL